MRVATKTIFWAVLAACAFSAVAAGSEVDINTVRSMVKTQVDAIEKLPVSGLNFIEANGRTFLVSDNGRIVVTGRIYDMWNNVEINSKADVEKYANKIDLAKLGLNIDELGAINIGGGKQEIVVFIDPNCAPCHKLLQQAAKLNQYTWRVIMLPITGDEAVDKVKRGVCSNDKASIAKALLDNAWTKVPAPARDCNTLPMQKAIVSARVFGINTVPALIRHDGAVFFGVPKELGDWAAEPGDRTPDPKLAKGKSTNAK